MANRVHAPVHGMEPQPHHSPIDRVFAQAKPDELSPRDHTMLAPRQLRDCRLEGVLRNLTAHYTVK